MTRDSTTFNKYSPCNEGTITLILDGSFSVVASIGLDIISRDIRLDSILSVPNLDYNLLSISKLTHDLYCFTDSPNFE